MNPVPVGPSGSGLTVHHVPRQGGVQQQQQQPPPNANAMGGGAGRVVAGGVPPPPGGRKPTPGGKLMRLRCRFHPLHDTYIKKDGSIREKDSDVIFLCGDGHQVKAHKVILASSSQFFSKLFEDQGKITSVVNVPDIKVDVMKLILQLTYRDHVILSMKQIKEVGDFITLFGMAWTQFGYEEHEGAEAMSAQPMNPIPMKPVELPKKVVYVTQQQSTALPQQQPQQRTTGGPPPATAGRQTPLKNEVKTDNEYLQQQQQAQMERHSRKTKLTPRPGTDGEEVIEHEEDEDPENKMRDAWMSHLGEGKRVSPTSSAQLGAGDAKKIRLDNTSPLKVVKQQETKGASEQRICTTCNARFKTELAWRWHEDRHVGLHKFKCQFCDELVETPKACYIHEKETHGYNGMTDLKQPQQQGQPAKPQQQRNVFVRPHQPNKLTTVPSGYAASKIKMGYKKMQNLQKKKSEGGLPFGGKNQHPKIQIAKSQGIESFDAKKMKQLHWMYVCQNCENCADSASKAILHYEECYPNKELEFEATVVKHKQGFYGKSKCPLCPKCYPQNNGFMIHCGQQHPQYRRLFQNANTGAGGDQLKCVSCKILFADPTTFHEHLVQSADGAYSCGGKAVVEEGKIAPSSSAKQAATAAGRGRPTNAAKPKLRAKAVKRPESPMESKASYKVQFHTPPKSARLASRVQAEATAEAAKAKAKMAAIDFPSVDCPVCGEADVPNISLHLQNKHTDLKIEMTRVSSELLRCKHCTITFSVCDLLDHKNCHLSGETETSSTSAAAPVEADQENSNDGQTSSRRSSTASGSATARPAKPVADIDSLPPGVGRSPIEKIEIEDLHSIKAIRSALRCAVCGTTATKLGTIADCLRSHGIQRCSLCFNSYCNKADYTLHLKKCHGSTTGNKLKCPLCPKAFSNAGQTSGHMYSTHWLQILKENELAVQNEVQGNTEGKTDNEKGDNNEMNGSGSTLEQDENEDGAEENESGRGEDEDDDGGDDEDAKQNENGEEDMIQVEGSNDADLNEADTSK